MAVEIRDPRVVSAGLDLRELTFQNVVDNILGPSGIKIGGFPEDLFQDLTEQERQDMMCNICFLIANDCRLCNNDHVFCHSCVVAWSMTFGENAHKCPVCRCDQTEYNVSAELENRIRSKQVLCREEGCCFQSTLADYLLHSHGKAAYSNAHVDFGCLGPRLFRPVSATENSSQPGVSTSIRSQLLQSRTMIQQMMMLMRIEMHLRQQALFNFQQSQDSDAEQTPRLDDALALNSQLSEISSVLSTLIRSSPVVQRTGRRRPTYRELPGTQRLRRADGSGFVRAAALRRLSNVSGRLWRETFHLDNAVNDDSTTTDDDDDSDDDDDDEVLNTRSTASVNRAVDDFIWQRLNESDSIVEGISVDFVRSSPENVLATSTLPAIQSVSSLQSIPPSIQSVASNQSLSGISAVNSYIPSMSSSISYLPSMSPSVTNESGQITPGFMLCMNSDQPATAERQCSHQLCTAFDDVAVAGVDEDELLPGSRREVRVQPNPSVTGDGAVLSRSRQVDVLNPSSPVECGATAAVCEPSLSESTNGCQTYSLQSVEFANASRRTLPPVVPAGRSSSVLQPSLPVVSRESTRQPVMDISPLSLLPGSRRPPHLNYAARLRQQAAEMTRLPSEVSIRPWPFLDASHATIGNRLTSPNGFANRRAGPNTRQPPTYLPLRQSSVVGPTPHRSGTYHGRTTLPSRYNAPSSGDRTRMSRL